MNIEFKPVINDCVKESIKEYCKQRHYKCRGCRYSIKVILPDYSGFGTCIFGNCPCDWEVKND